MPKVLIGNFKGPKGEPGDTGPQGVPGTEGQPGPTGERGSKWYIGVAITGVSEIETIFEHSGIDDAMVNDMYVNTDTGNIYHCTVPGIASEAKWVYSGNIKGPKGDPGESRSQDASNVNMTGYVKISKAPIVEEDNVLSAIGKLETSLDDCFQSVSDGKTLVASAITDKGVPTTSDATYDTLAANIMNIQTGIDISDTTATAEDVVNDKTFYDATGNKITGTITPMPGLSMAQWATSQNDGIHVWIPKGAYRSAGDNGVHPEVLIDKNDLYLSIGIDSSKMLNTLTVGGITGDIETKSAYESCASSFLYGENLFLQINKGAYITSPEGSPYPQISITQASLASTLGITPEKIVAPNTICGVKGTASSGKKYAEIVQPFRYNSNYIIRNDFDKSLLYGCCTLTLSGLGFTPAMVAGIYIDGSLPRVFLVRNTEKVVKIEGAGDTSGLVVGHREDNGPMFDGTTVVLPIGYVFSGLQVSLRIYE